MIGAIILISGVACGIGFFAGYVACYKIEKRSLADERATQTRSASLQAPVATVPYLRRKAVLGL